MIWVTDKTGGVIYVSPEWTQITGQEAADALGEGWLDAVHPGDRDDMRILFKAALQAQKTFGITYRLRLVDGTYIWVASGAVASHGPPAATFLGFLGSVTKLEVELSRGAASHMIGRFVPPPPHPQTLAHGPLDLLADHLIIAHALATEDGGKTAIPFIDSALAAVGMELARAPKGRDMPRR